MKNEIEKLRKWVEENSSAELAAQLGYRSSTTIDKWIERGSIPRWMYGAVMEIIAKKGVKTK